MKKSTMSFHEKPSMDYLKVPARSSRARHDSNASVETVDDDELASSNELKQALECPICNEVPLAPIYTCSEGHTTCGKCRHGFRCAICDEDLSNTTRNAAMEVIVAGSSFWCKYVVEGCPEIMKGSEYREHLTECDYRNVAVSISSSQSQFVMYFHFRKIKCYEMDIKECNGELVFFKDYFEHLKKVHEVEGWTMNSKSLVMSEYSNDLMTDGPWPTYYLEYNDETILRNIHSENCVVYLWFTLLGSTAEASRYRVKVTVYMKHDETSKLDWIVPVYPIRTQSPSGNRDIFRVAIPSRQLQMYCSRRRHPHGEVYKYVVDLKYEILVN